LYFSGNSTGFNVKCSNVDHQHLDSQQPHISASHTNGLWRLMQGKQIFTAKTVLVLVDTKSIRLMIFHIIDVSPTMVCLIVDSPIAILPYVCLPKQPLTKRAFIVNLTWPNQPALANPQW